MSHVIENAPPGQAACPVNEWLDLLKDAVRRGLIDPAAGGTLEGGYALGLLTSDGLPERFLDLLRAGPAAGLALDAIAPLFEPGDVIELRALDPAGGGGLSCCGRLDVPEQRTALETFIRDHIGRRNLYVGCNPRREDMTGTARSASAADVPVRRNVVLDFDRKDAPPMDPDWTRTVDALRAQLDPALVLNSGNGFHVWLPIEPMSGADLDASTAPLAAAMARIGSDNMADPPRIVRLPFTINLPNAKKRARGAIVGLAIPC